MKMLIRPDICRQCRQDLVRDCPADDHRASPCLVATLHKFVLAEEGMGITCDDLLEMLNGGVTIAEILDVMMTKGAAIQQVH